MTSVRHVAFHCAGPLEIAIIQYRRLNFLVKIFFTSIIWASSIFVDQWFTKDLMYIFFFSSLSFTKDIYEYFHLKFSWYIHFLSSSLSLQLCTASLLLVVIVLVPIVIYHILSPYLNPNLENFLISL